MATFTLHTTETAPVASQAQLQKVRQIFGVVPNLQAHLAESPEALSGYLVLLELFSRSSLSAVEQQVVSMATNFQNNCSYSMAGHSARAIQTGMDASLVTALREGVPLADRKLEALRCFTNQVVRERGRVHETEVAAFRDAGYTRQNALDVLLGVAAKILGNYTNHVARTQYDEFMHGYEWSKPHHFDSGTTPPGDSAM